MDDSILDIYRLPIIRECEDINLLALSEQCAVLEEQVHVIAKALSSEDRRIVEAYISTRNDLEVETVKAVFRWGKRKQIENNPFPK